jgi:hypothetical protein
MKHLLLGVVFTSMFVPSNTQAQLYIKGGVGYAASLGGIQIDRDRTETAAGDDFKYHYGSFGSGFELGGTVGYTLRPDVAVEMGIWYDLGPKYEAKDTRLNPAQNRNRSYSGSLIGLSPAFVVSGELARVKGYARFGIIVGFPEYEVVDTRPNATTTDKYSGGLVFGFQGGLGVLIPLGSNLSAFGELSLQSGSWSPTKLEQTSGVTTTTITLKDAYNSSEQFVDAQPSIPYGNVGLRVGLKVDL